MKKQKITEPDRTPNPIDIHVGKRIRDRRKDLRVSQEKLAEQLGLTFQQVQKYEKGANRVSASKLYEIARALQASVEYFFRGLADPSVAAGELADAQPVPGDMVPASEGRELASEFPKIRDPRIRRRVLELVKSLAENPPL
jgi:transcriptional regulator with XRE-family HTH domain